MDGNRYHMSDMSKNPRIYAGFLLVFLLDTSGGILWAKENRYEKQ